MTRNNNDFKQPITLYRGLAGVTTLSGVNFTGLGSHWTRTPEVALNFATGQGVDDFGESPDGFSGMFITAKVDPKHVIDPESDEGKDWQENAYVFDRSHNENEHTVLPGSPISITKIVKATVDYSIRGGIRPARTYRKFPKKGTA